MTTPAPNPRSTPPPGTYEAASRGCACMAAGWWKWHVPNNDDDRRNLWRLQCLPPMLEHKPGCVLAKERP